MRRCPTIADLTETLADARRAQRSVGFVPTMGSLHAGHLSLVERSVAENDLTVVSIFVNPAQFGPGTDLERYPRDLTRDAGLLERAGVDALFHPDAREIYPPGFATWVEVEGLGDLLDGASRPGYFCGICTVVLKLFEIVRPTATYFGQKDVQQARVIDRLIRDLHLPITMHVVPIVREPDGLAMSSRNTYLTDADRETAALINRGLEQAGAAFTQGERSAAVIADTCRAVLASAPELIVDYVEVVDLDQMQRVDRIDAPVVLAVAVDLRGTRLIDNVILGE